MIQLERSGDILTVYMDRPLNADGVKMLQKALRGQWNGVRHLVIDANGTSVIDEEGLQYLQLLDDKMLNTVDGTFRLVHIGERLQDMMAADDWSDVLEDRDW